MIKKQLNRTKIKPIGIGTGNNPNSHRNSPRVSDSETPSLKNVNLLPSDWEFLDKISGNRSKAVRELINIKRGNKTLNLICGIPGDGKTTLANKLPGIAITADDYPGVYVDGIYQSHLQSQSHAWCIKTVEESMKEGLEITVHNTFTRNIYRKPYIELAAKYGYMVHVITSNAVILPDIPIPTP